MSFKQALILVVVLLALASAGDAVSGVVKSGQLDWYELTKSVVLLLTSAFIAWKMEE